MFKWQRLLGQPWSRHTAGTKTSEGILNSSKDRKESVTFTWEIKHSLKQTWFSFVHLFTTQTCWGVNHVSKGWVRGSDEVEKQHQIQPRQWRSHPGLTFKVKLNSNLVISVASPSWHQEPVLWKSFIARHLPQPWIISSK